MSSLKSRPRRTRIYDANYQRGENLYKSALDDLDRKHGHVGVSSIPTVTPISPPRTTRFNLEDPFDSELAEARNRAHRAITDEPSLFDSRGARVSRGLPLSSAFADEEDDHLSSITRIRAARQQKLNSLVNEVDLDDSFDTIKKRANIDLGSKLLDVAGEDDIGSAIRSKALKAIKGSEEDDFGSSFVSRFKRTAISDVTESSNTNSSASLRAQATKARLADIETDIFNRSEKQDQRERRAANLKKILAENDIAEVKSKKVVSF